MPDGEGRYRDFLSEPAHGVTHRVIIGKSISEGFEAADAFEGAFPEGDGRPKAGTSEAKLKSDKDARKEMLVDGSSLTISDSGLGMETGQGTDFITITHSSSKG